MIIEARIKHAKVLDIVTNNVMDLKNDKCVAITTCIGNIKIKKGVKAQVHIVVTTEEENFIRLSAKNRCISIKETT